MKIVTVVGARPQFIKAAAMSRILRETHVEVLVHTGQHHDPMMSDVFFTELQIPHPDYDLGISGGSHAQMTARMLTALEEVLIKEAPDALLIYGDTNSTLAAALAAVKLRIPVIHVEAGNRLGTLDNPEEINRIVADHTAKLLFACVPSAVEALKKENLQDRAYLVGDPMLDAFCHYRQWNGGQPPQTLSGLDGHAVRTPERFYYLTCHREENTRTDDTLAQILMAMESLPHPTLYPVHPRNHAAAVRLGQKLKLQNVKLLSPIGYLESIALVANAQRVVTDSGGVQREAFFAHVPCVTVFPYAVWPETMPGMCNVLAAPETEDILAKLSVTPAWSDAASPFGDGHACEKIIAHLPEALR
ncbi:MAG: UDP-N-acetylglucosamine 2-epimerase (non-hydrolyzing) [Eubacteriales bacterium]|nr:UDP-N-acetylglucosamine 2-epimerase (non-hydrolyzing) [Eubacteriales bacterium]